MATQLRLSIPRKRRRQVIALGVITTIVVVFSILAVYDLITQEAILAPVLWLIFISFGIGQQIGEEGGLRQYVFSFLGTFVGREYVELAPAVTLPPALEFCIQIFTLRSVQRRVPLNQITNVHWSQGQGSALSGRDMGDWLVFVYYKDPTKRTGKGIRALGSGRSKKVAEALGVALLALLRDGGLALTLREETLRYGTRLSYQP